MLGWNCEKRVADESAGKRARRGGGARHGRTGATAIAVALAAMLTAGRADALNPGDVTIAAITPWAAVDSNNCAGGAGPHAMYLQVRVTNATAGTLSGLSATLNGIPASPVSPPSPPTAFTLDQGESAQRFVGTLSPGAASNLYFLVNYPCALPPAAGSSISYTLTVSDATPNAVTSSSLTLTTRSEISANAGGDVLSATIGAGAVVGQILKVTINYSFGNPNSNADAMIQPVGNVSFDAARFRLLGADITSSTFTGGPITTNDNRLYFAPGTVTGPSQNSLTVDYYFIALATGAASTVVPFADLRSGGQVKYTGNFGTCTNQPCDQSLPPPNDPFVISKSASPTSLPSGGTVTYTVTVTNGSDYDASLDSILDTLPAGVTYQGLAPGSDVTAANSSVLPSIGASGAIIWQAQPGVPPPASAKHWFIAAHTSLTLVYQASVPNIAGTYTNSVTATSSNLTIGPVSANVFVGPTPTSTALPTATNTAVPTATDTAIPTATNTAVPTATDTAIPTATNTAIPTATNTAIPTATNTAVPTATDTAVPTATDTAIPTATDTAVPTATDTAVPTATDTAIPTATNTAIPTATNTAVPTATNTAIPTATNTAIPTATDTATPTATNTAIPTATNTAIPTATNTAVPTATNTAVPTATDTAVPTATDTAIPTATDTAIPTATDTAIPTATDTAVPTATDTAIPTATDTAVPTATDTAIPTATNTAIPTATDTAVPTATDTAVPTATDTAIPTATNTAIPTATDTAVPTATDTAVPTATDTAVPTATDTAAPSATATPAATDTPVPPTPTATDAPPPTPTVSLDCGNGILDAGEECDDGAGNSDTLPDACRSNCRLAGCGDGVADTPVADFVFVIETSLSMRGDLRRIPAAIGGFPELAAAAGVDYRVALVRFGSGRLKSGAQGPDLTLDFTTDGDAFRGALTALQSRLSGPTESGSEALDFALDSLALRPRALPIFILLTDEDDDLPVSIEPGRRREPPANWAFSDRAAQFQSRLDALAQRLASAGARMVLLMRPGNRPSESQYGAPRFAQSDGQGRLDLEATLSALAAAQLAGSLQGQLLAAGTCSAGRCTAGALGNTCSDDRDCGLYARAYDIKEARRRRTRDAFYAALLGELIELATCQP